MGDVNIGRQLGGKKVIWDNSAISNEIEVGSINAAYRLDLGAFNGTSVTYEVKNEAGQWIPLNKNGAAISDVVTANAGNVLSEDLFGAVPEMRIKSNQTENGEGFLKISG